MFKSSKFDKSGLKSGGHIRPGPDLKKRPDSGRGRGRIWYPVTSATLLFALFCVICVFTLLVVLYRLSLAVQVIDWKDSLD